MTCTPVINYNLNDHFHLRIVFCYTFLIYFLKHIAGLLLLTETFAFLTILETSRGILTFVEFLIPTYINYINFS